SAFARSGNGNDFSLAENIRADLLAQLDAFELPGSKFSQRADVVRKARLLKVAEFRKGETLVADLLEADLHGVVAVGVAFLDLRHENRSGLNDRNWHHLALFVEE